MHMPTTIAFALEGPRPGPQTWGCGRLLRHGRLSALQLGGTRRRGGLVWPADWPYRRPTRRPQIQPHPPSSALPAVYGERTRMMARGTACAY